MAVGQSVKRFLKESAFGGFYYVATAAGMGRRLFWVLVVLFCIVGLAAQAAIVFNHYNAALPSTSYAVEPKAQLVLPEAVVCLPVRFDKDRVEKERISDLLGEYLQTGFIYSAAGSITGIPTGVNTGDVARLLPATIEFNQYMNVHNLTYSEVVDRLAFSAHDILSWGCYYAGVHADCWKDARRLWTNYGLCYEVKSPPQAISGAGYGTMLRVETPRGRYYPGPSLAHGDGAMLKLSKDGELGMDLTLLPTGSRVQIELEAVKAKALPTKQNPCSPRPNQTHHMCFSECMINKFVDDSCDCVFIDMKEIGRNGDRPICTPIQLLQCVLSNEESSRFLTNQKIFKQDSEQSKLVDMMSNCSAGCEKSCTTWQYRKTISSFP